MNELLKVNYESERITLSARELHEFLNVTERFSSWFDRMKQYGFEENHDYLGRKVFNTLARQELQDYQITIDMAKEIAMLQRSDKGKEIRQYFIQLEREWNTPERVMARGLEASKLVIQKLNQQLLENKPKVEFYEAVADSKTAIPMDQVAKVLNFDGIGRNKLFQILRNKQILQLNNIPYQEYVDRGYFRVVETKYTKPSGETCISIKTLVYQKGVNYIRKLISADLERGLANANE